METTTAKNRINKRSLGTAYANLKSRSRQRPTENRKPRHLLCAQYLQARLTGLPLTAKCYRRVSP